MKFIKKLFNNNIITNEQGSTLSMAIIVIAVLSFTVTTVTGATISLSSTTTQQIENTNDESVGMGLITQALSEMEVYITAGGTYSDFNNIEAPRMLLDYSVDVTDVTAQFPDFGDVSGVESYVYRFAYTLSSGTDLVKYAYISVSGSTVSSPHPFQFSLGTNGDLVLNGGYYDEVDMFGNNIYMSNQSVWYEDDVMFQNYLTPTASGTFPDLEDGNNKSDMYFTNDYLYCDFACYTEDPNAINNTVINDSEFEDVQGSTLPEKGKIEPDNITDFFTNFDFESYFLDQITQNLPTDNRTITDTTTLLNWEDVIRDNMDIITYSGRRGRATYPNTPYVDLTNNNRYDWDNDNIEIKFAGVYDGDLIIRENMKVKDDDNEALVVLGNLTFDSSGQTQKINGTFVVAGNLYFMGDEKEFDDAMFLVMGETYFEMNDFEGLDTKDSSKAFTLLSYDNIRMNSINETNDNSDANEFIGFFYSEESIYVDAINSKIQLTGALYAKAAGNSANPLEYEYEDGSQFNGIMINSFRGYAVAQGGWEWIPGYGWSYEYNIVYAPSNRDDNNRFYVSTLREQDFDKAFLNLPTWDNVTVSDGVVTFENSEWKYE